MGLVLAYNNCEISIHALLAESDQRGRHHGLGSRISIHALLAESDLRCDLLRRHARNFYPRSPCGERQELEAWHAEAEQISIHALLAESDPSGRKTTQPTRHFYPRSPCGERL